MRSVFPIKLIQNMYLKNTFGLNLSFPRMFFQKKKKGWYEVLMSYKDLLHNIIYKIKR